VNEKRIKQLEGRLADAESRLRALLARVLPRTAESGELATRSSVPLGSCSSRPAAKPHPCTMSIVAVHGSCLSGSLAK
jgi:hypothetical protein